MYKYIQNWDHTLKTLSAFGRYMIITLGKFSDIYYATSKHN